MKKLYMSPVVPEIPVANFTTALDYYKNTLCFKIAWRDETQLLAAIIFDKALIYLRQRAQPFEPVVSWIATDDVDAHYKRFEQLGAILLNAPENKSWQHRQFSLQDKDANIFHIHKKLD